MNNLYIYYFYYSKVYAKLYNFCNMLNDAYRNARMT